MHLLIQRNIKDFGQIYKYAAAMETSMKDKYMNMQQRWKRKLKYSWQKFDVE